MNDTKTLVSSALASLIALGALAAQSDASAAQKQDMEKCYGIAKAGQNDCKTLSNACAGHSLQDGQKDAFIALPKGTCERLAGGTLAVPKADAE